MTVDYERFIQLSYAELESASGIKATSWCRYFTGRRSMKLNTLVSIAEKLGMPPEDLAKGVLHRTKPPTRR
jgi:transcriptional regulator with XRE-family HTH domain